MRKYIDSQQAVSTIQIEASKDSCSFGPGARTPLEAVSFLGLTVTPLTSENLTDVVERGVLEARKLIVSNHNLHSAYLIHRRRKLRDFYNMAGCIYIDGMPLIALGRLYGHALERSQRVTLADWIYPLMEIAALRGWRVFNLGSPDGVAEKGAATLRELYPGLQIEVHHGYFDERSGSIENEAVLEKINSFRPDLLMVGMGMPRQELWTLENLDRLDASVIFSSNGAAIDYVAGMVPTPPRWAGRLGLEWVFRLANEPKRLFARYLVEPWYILMLLAMDFLRKGGRLHTPIREETFGEGA